MNDVDAERAKGPQAVVLHRRPQKSVVEADDEVQVTKVTLAGSGAFAFSDAKQRLKPIPNRTKVGSRNSAYGIDGVARSSRA